MYIISEYLSFDVEQIATEAIFLHFWIQYWIHNDQKEVKGRKNSDDRCFIAIFSEWRPICAYIFKSRIICI